MFDANAAYEAIKKRAISLRIPISTLCRQAKVSPSNPVHWEAGRAKPTLTTIGALERELDRIEAERAS